MFVVCCQVEISATNWSLVHKSPNDCGATLCMITKPRERGGHSPRLAAEPQIIIIINMQTLKVDWFVWMGNCV
jgi:hypothetical protein